MGKQAKKKQKSDSQAASQQYHNPATRGVNTTKRGVVWAYRQRKVGDEVENYEVMVLPHTTWDPFDKAKNSRGAPEPFDHLSLDWREQLMHYAANIEAKIGTKNLGGGRYLHRVYNGKNIDKPDFLFLEIESSQKLLLKGRKKK